MKVSKNCITVKLSFGKMVSFHELQKPLLFSHAGWILSDEELLLLYEEYWPKKMLILAMRILEGFLWTI